MIPERVSHAYLAGLWPRIGLYSSIAAALAYAGFGRSRFLVAGTNPSLALLLSASIAPVAAQDPLLAAAMASATALMAGVLALGAWVLRLGLLSKAMSDHVLIGFNMGAGALVILGSCLRSSPGGATSRWAPGRSACCCWASACCRGVPWRRC